MNWTSTSVLLLVLIVTVAVLAGLVLTKPTWLQREPRPARVHVPSVFEPMPPTGPEWAAGLREPDPEPVVEQTLTTVRLVEVVPAEHAGAPVGIWWDESPEPLFAALVSEWAEREQRAVTAW